MLHQFAFLTLFLDIIADPTITPTPPPASPTSLGDFVILLSTVIAVVAITAMIIILIQHRKNIRKDDDK